MIKFQYRTIALALLLIGGVSMANAQVPNTQSNPGDEKTPPPPPPAQQVPPPPPGKV